MSQEIKTLREKITELDRKSTEMDQKSTARDKKLDRILFLLDNDDATGQKGLVASVKSLEKELPVQFQSVHSKIDKHIQDYDTDKKVQKAQAIKYGATAGTFVAGILTGIIKFFTGNTH